MAILGIDKSLTYSRYRFSRHILKTVVRGVVGEETPEILPVSQPFISPNPTVKIDSQQLRRGMSGYGASFCLTYLANSCLMVAVSLLFRYADFVTFLGGDEFTLGAIIGLGTVGAIAARAFQGIGIDRYGPRRIWLVSLFLLGLSILAHLAVDRIDSSAVYLVRILFASSVAGAFGGSITYVSLQAPVGRTAEMIGMLGTSGFVGMSIGPGLSDWLMDVEPIQRADLNRMFLVAACMVVCSIVFAHFATRNSVRITRRRTAPMIPVLRRYHPGTLLLVGIGMGFGIGLPHTFLRPYVSDLGIDRIRLFFWTYSAIAFLTRLATRRAADRWGVRSMIHLGLTCLAMSMLLFICVSEEWMLMIPAVVGGVAHAFLFPAAVAGANHAFPVRYRGLSTTLILAMFDLGVLVGQPTAGALLEGARHLGIPHYPLMFTSIALILMAINVAYAMSAIRRPMPPVVSVSVREPPQVSSEQTSTRPPESASQRSDPEIRLTSTRRRFDVG